MEQAINKQEKRSQEVQSIHELVDRASRKVLPEYFKLRIAALAENEVVRERVFCYELYHQMRSDKESKITSTLNGEVDKKGHRLFRKKHWKIPDFLFHTPGNMDENILIMEVKGELSDGISKDFKTLFRFTHSYGYEAGIFYIFNHNMDELKGKLKKLGLDKLRCNCLDKIHCVAVVPNTAPQWLRLDDLVQQIQG